MDYKAAIREAADAAAEAPDDLREIAFRSVLERLLGHKPGGAVGAEGGEKPSVGSEDMTQRQGWEERVKEGLPEAHLVQENGDRKQQAVWAVATLHARGCEVTTEEIMKLIRTELGLAPQNEQNMARTLRTATPRFIMRRDRPAGRGYVYEPTARANDAFEGLV